MKKRFPILLVVNIALLTGLAFMSAKIYDLQRSFEDKPKEIIIANVTPTSVDIYWKGIHEGVPTFSYREEKATGLFKQGSMNIFNNTLSPENIYISTITELDPNTEYVYEIKTDNKTWSDDNSFKFKTTTIADAPSIPESITGSSTPKSFVLIKSDDKNYILDTQYNGTWAMDLDSENYEESIYGNYLSDNQLKEYSAQVFGIKTAYADSGANCKSGASANYSGGSKAKIADLAERWVAGCPKGHYANECYSDVVCRASSKGVDPAFALTIWLNESGASNYANLSSVQDFGINGGGIPGHDFNQQLDRFLSLVSQGESYLSGHSSCGYDNAISKASATNSGIDSKLIVWGAVFKSGDGCNTSAGLTYISTISTEYNWVTGGTLKWPLTKSSSVGDCNFSGVSSGYNSCSSTGTSVTPGGEDDDDDPTPTGKIACGSYGCNVDQDCQGYEDGIECDQKLSHKASDQRCVRYECPSGYKVGSDGCTCERNEKVCCLTDNTLEMKYPSECSGTIQDGLTSSTCRISTQVITLSNGVNFVSTKFTPYSENEKLTASILMNKYKNIILIGEHFGDKWQNLLVKEKDSVKGEDFDILGQRAYLIITNQDMSLELNGYGISPLSLSEYKGWALTPKDLIGKYSTKQIITSYEDLNINQLAVWDNKSSMFSNLNIDVSGEIYGEDQSLSSVSSLFVKIE
jgi:hypothetical protein